MGELYKFTFPNGKCYIGLTERSAALRVKGHARSVRLGSLLAVHCAWRKYGPPKLTILKMASGDALFKAEISAIKRLKTLTPNGYNLSFGGDINPMKRPEIAAKTAAALRTISLGNTAHLGFKNDGRF